jgi:hypothetical protein
MDIDPNLSPPHQTSFQKLVRKVSETTFYRKTMIYRAAFLRGGLGVAIAMLVENRAHPEDDWKGTVLAGLIAWRLFIDNSTGQAKEEAKKLL